MPAFNSNSEGRIRHGVLQCSLPHVGLVVWCRRQYTAADYCMIYCLRKCDWKNVCQNLLEMRWAGLIKWISVRLRNKRNKQMSKVFVGLYMFTVWTQHLNTENRIKNTLRESRKYQWNIVCVVYYNLCGLCNIVSQRRNINWVLTWQAVWVQDWLWIDACMYGTNKTECM